MQCAPRFCGFFRSVLTFFVTIDTLGRKNTACQQKKRKKAMSMAKMQDDGFCARFGEVLSRVGSLQSAAEMTGYSTDQVAKWRDGKSRPPFHPISILTKAAGLSLDWLATGVEPKSPLHLTNVSALPDDVALIPFLNIQGGAGAGVQNGPPELLEQMPFSATILRELGVNTSNCHIIRARGESMEPTIRDGAVVLVDVSRRRDREDSVYALMFGEDVRIKRLAFGAFGGLTLMSDNPAYPDEVLGRADLDQVKIVGKVIWVGGGL